MTKKLRRILILSGLTAALLFSSGCGAQVAFEKLDLKGHVRVEHEGVGYCFHVPKNWEIREQLEGADVVCLAPLEDGFRDSIIAKSISAAQLTEPEKAVEREIARLGSRVKVQEPWAAFDKPAVVVLEEPKFSKKPLSQLIYLYHREDGSGVLITCTTTGQGFAAKRSVFEEIVAKANFKVEECGGPAGLPKVFPTPEVTLSPAP